MKDLEKLQLFCKANDYILEELGDKYTIATVNDNWGIESYKLDINVGKYNLYHLGLVGGITWHRQVPHKITIEDIFQIMVSHDFKLDRHGSTSVPPKKEGITWKDLEHIYV